MCPSYQEGTAYERSTAADASTAGRTLLRVCASPLSSRVPQDFRCLWQRRGEQRERRRPFNWWRQTQGYNHPFKFFLVHETHPNAFATPGGNVYVVDSLLYFVKNTEQLAGTLCHEVSHTIHRDAMARLKEQQRIERRELGIALLLRPSLAQMLAMQMIGDLHSLAYSRDVESSADVTGSDICAASGYNPWGLVWFFEEFQNADPNQIPQLLSDHPANGVRVQTLGQHFRENPSVFSKFDSRPEWATPLIVPKRRNRAILASVRPADNVLSPSTGEPQCRNSSRQSSERE